MLKSPPAIAVDPGSVPGSGRSPGGGDGSPLQYSCLENPVDRGAGWLPSVESQRVQSDSEAKQQHEQLYRENLTVEMK